MASTVLPVTDMGTTVGHILMVDDDPGVRVALRALFESAGYQVTEAVCGRAALRALERGPLPHVIVLDLDMPGMNGVAFRLRQLNDERIADVPVIVHSCAPSPETLGDILHAHAYVTKPANAELLLDTVARLVTSR